MKQHGSIVFHVSYGSWSHLTISIWIQNTCNPVYSKKCADRNIEIEIGNSNKSKFWVLCRNFEYKQNKIDGSCQWKKLEILKCYWNFTPFWPNMYPLRFCKDESLITSLDMSEVWENYCSTTSFHKTSEFICCKFITLWISYKNLRFTNSWEAWCVNKLNFLIFRLKLSDFFSLVFLVK